MGWMWPVRMQLKGSEYEAWRKGQIAENNKRLAELLGVDFILDATRYRLSSDSFFMNYEFWCEDLCFHLNCVHVLCLVDFVKFPRVRGKQTKARTQGPRGGQARKSVRLATKEAKSMAESADERGSSGEESLKTGSTYSPEGDEVSRGEEESSLPKVTTLYCGLSQVYFCSFYSSSTMIHFHSLCRPEDQSRRKYQVSSQCPPLFRCSQWQECQCLWWGQVLQEGNGCSPAQPVECNIWVSGLDLWP